MRIATDTIAHSRVIELPTPNRVSQPIDIAISSIGQVFVADARLRRIRVFDREGRWLTDWQPPTGRVPGALTSAACALPTVAAIAIDPGGGASGRPETVHAIWQCPFASRQLVESRRLDQPAATAQFHELGFRLDDVGVERQSGDLAVLLDDEIVLWSLSAGQMTGGMNVGAHRAAPGQFAMLGRDQCILIQRVDDSPRVVVVGANGEVRIIDLGALLPLSVSADSAAEAVVLVRSAVDGGQGPVIVSVDLRSGDLRRLVEADGDSPVPPDSSWPWQVDASADGMAMVTADRTLGVQTYDWAGRRKATMPGPVYSSTGWSQTHDTPPPTDLPLTVWPGHGFAVLDRAEGFIHVLATDGGDGESMPVPLDAIDVTASAQGLLYVSTEDGRLLWWDGHGGYGEQSLPGYTGRIDPGSGRIAAADARLYVAWPVSRTVAVSDIPTGTLRLGVQQPAARSSWPADVAASADGRGFGADLGRRSVATWNAAGTLLGEWGSGLLGGPIRLAYGVGAEGAGVVGAWTQDGYLELHGAESGELRARSAPVDETGQSIRVSDLALDGHGHLFLSDSARRVVHELVRAAQPPGPTATPLVTPGPAQCKVDGNKQAAPREVVLGGMATVSLTLRAGCPAGSAVVGADVVVLVQFSTGMIGEKMALARTAAIALVQQLDPQNDRAALMIYNSGAVPIVGLTHDLAGVLQAIKALPSAGAAGSNLPDAIQRADSQLASEGRPGAVPVIVLISDGSSELRGPGSPWPDPRPAAEAARNRGVQIYTVGVGAFVFEALLQEIAGSPRRYHHAQPGDEAFQLYREILSNVYASLAGQVIIEDIMSQDVEYVRGSAFPAAVEDGVGLRWGSHVIPASGMTLTYRIRALSPGTIETNKSAVAEYRDADDALRRLVFPIPVIHVVTPTPTPTNTASPTPSPVPTALPTGVPTSSLRRRINLPLILRHRCPDTRRGMDVALVIDASESMRDGAEGATTKLELAREAARSLVAQLRDDWGDQAAVVSYSAQPVVHQTLTNFRPAIWSALDAIGSGVGSRLDLGIDAAVVELGSGRHRPDNGTVIVIASDGRIAPEDLAAATRGVRTARGAGTMVAVIGIGEPDEAQVLGGLASSTKDVFVVRTSAEAAATGPAIAQRIACPGDSTFGRR